jgi:catechol 2,3-dioxygenase-like lactoylglutathione lyase family enzyme
MYQPPFHIGILVFDIEQAVRDFSEALGIEFEPIKTATVATGDTLRFGYAHQPAPMLELVEASGSGIWRPEQGEGLHHLGYSTPDVRASCPAFGEGIDTIVPGATPEDGPLVVYTRPELLHGVRVEFLHTSIVEATMANLAAHRSV